MALVEKIREFLGGREERQYSHQCGECGREFESPHHNPNKVSCPDCGSDRTHMAT